MIAVKWWWRRRFGLQPSALHFLLVVRDRDVVGWARGGEILGHARARVAMSRCSA